MMEGRDDGGESVVCRKCNMCAIGGGGVRSLVIGDCWEVHWLWDRKNADYF